MKKSIVWSAITCFALSSAIAQTKLRQIEIKPYVRMDWYPEFTYAINPVRTNYVKIKGISYGLNVAYKVPFTASVFFKPVIGYYRYGFNKIRGFTTSFGESTARVINYPSTIDVIFTTDKYWYHTISGSIGIEKLLAAKKSLQIVIGVDLNRYYTFSQGYHINRENLNNPYKRDRNRMFGFSAGFHAGVLKQIDKVRIGPSIIFPVYDRWRQDEIFPGEANSDARSKWLRGIGVGITLVF